MTPAPSVRSTGARDNNTGWVKKKTNLSQSEVDYKKLALVNDDLLKVGNVTMIIMNNHDENCRCGKSLKQRIPS